MSNTMGGTFTGPPQPRQCVRCQRYENAGERGWLVYGWDRLCPQCRDAGQNCCVKDCGKFGTVVTKHCADHFKSLTRLTLNAIDEARAVVGAYDGGHIPSATVERLKAAIAAYDEASS